MVGGMKMTEWNKDKEKKILQKYRFTLSVRIIKILIACLFLFWVYMMIVSISYDSTHLDRKHAYYSKLATDWTAPNVQEDFGSIVQSEITPFLTQKISYPVSKLVGKEYKTIGEMEISKTLLSTFSQKGIRYFTQNESDTSHFFLPEHPKTGKKLTANSDPGVWSKLDKLHEGTVGELAFSTTEFMSAEELLELLKPFDVDVLWAPLYTGEFQSFEPSGYGGGGDQISINYVFGLTGGREISNDYLSEGKMTYLKEDSLEYSQKMMLENMKYLLEEESKAYYESFLGLSFLDERYQYLQKNGFTVYGAVITGPVKELLKLQNVEEIQGARLGDLDYWNWE
jgi:hypothetical protein